MSSYKTAVPLHGQKYHKLKRECRKKTRLFVDPLFPPNGRSLFHSKPADSSIIWKRPSELVADPRFFLDEASADDFSQGSLGNCWFVAACACIAEDSKLWKKVVPDHDEQEWKLQNKYAGIFHFKFCHCGEWADVVIDDYLPTKSGHLIYMHSTKRNEFWSALLEKAYAKMFGSYEALTAGKARDAMVDMTGGVGESISLSQYKTEEDRMKLFDILEEAYENRSLISASIEARTKCDMEMKLAVGLVKGHAYSITAARKIRLGTSLLAFFKREKIHMIRCRNPWGGVEWKGPWSDRSPEWRNVTESQKKELDLTFDENGEFWMAFEDFCHYYTDIDVCHIINTSFFSFKKTWKEAIGTGEWMLPNRAGGCMNFQTFLNNPQYFLDVDDEQELMVSLEQADRRAGKGREKENYVIGVTILKTDMNRKYRVHDRMLEKVHSGPFSNSRSIFARITLKRGRYCIIPSTFDQRKIGRYMLRLYSNTDIHLREVVLDGPRPPACCGVQYRAVTAVTVVRGEDLGNGKKNKVDPYCFIKCEKKEVRISTVKQSSNPEWKERATFFRRKPEMDIIIEVWDNNVLLRDKLLGHVTIPMASSNWSKYKDERKVVRYILSRSENEPSAEKVGYLWINVQHSQDLNEL